MTATVYPRAECNHERDLLRSLSDALHDMSQPLTSVVFAIELSGLDDNEDSRRLMLTSARTECSRVLEQVAHMRVLCEELIQQGRIAQEVA